MSAASLISIRRTSVHVLLIVLASVGVFLAGGELYFRVTVPFNHTQWPSRFTPDVGFTFEPGATVRHTNHVDFWTTTKANSLGFLDREPPGTKVPGVCRIALIGDSFVEAAQVPIDQKFQVLLERMLSERYPTRRFETFAMGYSGTGQMNQLTFYDVLARPLSPDVVVLVVVANDFANNSSVLEAVRNGWHPRHAPRLFAQRDPATGEIVTQPIDPKWSERILPMPVSSNPTVIQRTHRILLKTSYFYSWLFRNLKVQHPDQVSFLESSTSYEEILQARMRAIEELSGFETVFDRWNYPNDLDYDTLFFADEIPDVFEEAILYTGYALDQFVERSRAHGFTLLTLSTTSLSSRYDNQQILKGRRMVDRGYHQRLVELVSARGIPVIDQYAHITQRGGAVDEAGFKRDGHWSPQGHIWAAEALAGYFGNNPELCAE